MKYILKLFDWELNNEYKTSGYFCVMLICYMIAESFYGRHYIEFSTLIQMYLLNYGISTVQSIFLGKNKSLSNKTYYIRAIFLSILSLIITVLVTHWSGWFEHSSTYAEVFMYVCMISSYLFVWFMDWGMKHYNTKELNQQLELFKQQHQQGGNL